MVIGYCPALPFASRTRTRWLASMASGSVTVASALDSATLTRRTPAASSAVPSAESVWLDSGVPGPAGPRGPGEPGWEAPPLALPLPEGNVGARKAGGRAGAEGLRKMNGILG